MLLRENAGILEVLLLKRNAQLSFAPNVWVFPGGRVDPEDGLRDEPCTLETAKKAAVRECKEETGINIDATSLHHFCKWTTPKGGNKRFETFFFHSIVLHEQSKVTIDDSEIVDQMWLTAREALDQLLSKKIDLLPPTFISIERIKDCTTYADVIKEFDRTGIVIAEPVTTFKDGKFYSLYRGDSGYETADLTKQNSLHRLTMDMSSSRYTIQHDNTPQPPVHGGVSLTSPEPR